MPTFSQRIVLLKVVGWSLRVLTGILLIVMAIIVITSLPNITPASPNADSNIASLIQELLYLIVPTGVIFFISSFVFSTIRHQEGDIDDKLLGYVASNYSTNLATLAAWLNLTPKEIADRMAKLVSAREVFGVNIDLANGTISQGTLPTAESPSPSQALPYTTVSAPNTMVQSTPVPSESDEAIKIKAKLYELEVLKQQGKISIPAYNKLKEEYETKLAQVDTGTKVY